MIRYSVSLWSHTVIFMTTEKHRQHSSTTKRALTHTHKHTHTWEKKAGDIGTRLIYTCLWLIYTTVLQSNGRHQLAGTAIYWY